MHIVRSNTLILIKKNIEKGHHKRLISESENKSKIKYIKHGKGDIKQKHRSPYLNKLNRRECSIIFKARTRMLDIKENFRGKYTNNLCRAGHAQTKLKHRTIY